MLQEVELQTESNEAKRDRSLRFRNAILQAALLISVAVAAIFMYKTYHQYNVAFPEIAPPPSNTDASGNNQAASANGIEARAAYGQYGDFIGGSLNPILSFLSLIAVLFTVSLQITELQQNREELRETREVAVQQKKHFEDEAKKSEIIQALQQYEKAYDSHANIEFRFATKPYRGLFDGKIEIISAHMARIDEYGDGESFIWGTGETPTNHVLLEMYNLMIGIDDLSDRYRSISNLKDAAPIVRYYKTKYWRHAFAFSKWEERGEEKFKILF